MRYAILGAGGMAREVREILVEQGVPGEHIEFFVDASFKADHPDSREISELQSTPFGALRIVMGAGSGELRETWFRNNPSFANHLQPLIAPSATLGKRVTLGTGGLVGHGCILTCDVSLGKCAQLNIQTSLSHDVTVGDFFTSGPKTTLAGNVTVGHRVTLGAATTVLPGVSICDDVVVGAGAVVTKDITEPGTYVGVPAKRIF